ncbi:UbiD family decarboxylase [Roseomonas sp. E05]|uniref:UbiD family decarboxylase n=1 Tax=Roseomonas sp. E05 TaxID=3046310 RepID=UPI0024BAAACD|nr:UbiD family decarboxylase [Roseomonas sp. E05]MDJ0391181.1 UbiD family decarboxylase [Roseomonas sp. E05]
MSASEAPVTAPCRSLRDWIDRLARSGRLAIAEPGRALRFELAGIANRLDGRQASLFPHPDGHPGSVVSGLTSDRGWMAEAMGVAPSALLARFQAAAASPLPWREVSPSEAPAQQVVHTSGIDLQALLPIPTHNEHDSGAYITAGLLIARNPRTGVQNVSIHRLQVSGPDRLGVLLLPRHAMAYLQMAEEAEADLEVAIAIGVDPLTLLASQAIAPLDQDELEIAGALHGAPLPVVRCRSNRVRVPAEAEIVIEGRVLREAREPEGPFGEFPQYYGERAPRHVIQVEAVTHRRNPLFHTIVGGGLEHLLLGGIPREATLLSHLQRSFPHVRDVHLSKGGVCRYHLHVQLDKRSEGEAKNVILGAFGGHYDIKQVVVVDTDVDIHDPREVEWAIATRFQADRDLVVIREAQGSKLDPSTRDGLGAKMGLDATVPLDAPPMRFTRIAVPGEREIELGAVLQRTDPARWTAQLGG